MRAGGAALLLADAPPPSLVRWYPALHGTQFQCTAAPCIASHRIGLKDPQQHQNPVAIPGTLLFRGDQEVKGMVV